MIDDYHNTELSTIKRLMSFMHISHKEKENDIVRGREREREDSRVFKLSFKECTQSAENNILSVWFVSHISI